MTLAAQLSSPRSDTDVGWSSLLSVTITDDVSLLSVTGIDDVSISSSRRSDEVPVLSVIGTDGAPLAPSSSSSFWSLSLTFSFFFSLGYFAGNFPLVFLLGVVSASDFSSVDGLLALSPRRRSDRLRVRLLAPPVEIPGCRTGLGGVAGSALLSGPAVNSNGGVNSSSSPSNALSSSSVYNRICGYSCESAASGARNGEICGALGISSLITNHLGDPSARSIRSDEGSAVGFCTSSSLNICNGTGCSSSTSVSAASMPLSSSSTAVDVPL